jgi:hypothetical protein
MGWASKCPSVNECRSNILKLRGQKSKVSFSKASELVRDGTHNLHC